MNFLYKALDFIFPPVCGICNKIAEGYLCKQCKENIINSKVFLNKLDFLNIDSQNNVEQHFYLFSYEGIIRKKILEYKFENKPYLANTFSEFFINNEKLYRFFKNYDIMIAVPISLSREKERGYNQSELIARNIRNIAFEKNLLVKVKDNQPQSKLDKKQRLENVKDVYKIKDKQKINGKRILIFDDIYTTGATAKECANLLMQEGAKSVGILTIAKDLL